MWQEQKIWQKVNILYSNNLWLFAKSLSPAGQARRWTFATDSIICNFRAGYDYFFAIKMTDII
jgi:hypothetical protein